jgi:hypothetical protein
MEVIMDKGAELQQAREYVVKGKKLEARNLLRRIIQTDNRNEQAWLLFSQVAEKQEHEIQCLEIVLKINPNNEQARKRLSLLRPPPIITEKTVSPESSITIPEKSQLFPARFSHPRLTPPIITDPLNPLFINILLQIESEKMIFNTEPLLSRGKILGEERLCDINNLRMEYLKAGKRREEIFKKSIVRGLLWGAIFFFIFLFAGSYGVGYLIPMITIVGIVGGSLYFMLNGGITTWDDKVRYTCGIINENKPFILEIDPKYGEDINTALLSNGMRIERIGN